jgi:nitroreductase
MATVEELVVRNRSCRRFCEARRVDPQTLTALVDLARRTASAGNRQPLRYMAFTAAADCEAIFPHLRWAALLKDWRGPAAGERPAAYVFVLAHTADGGIPQCDAGIAMQTLLLAAAERGLAGCMLGAVDRPKLAGACGLPAGHELLYVVALGEPAEVCVLEDARGGDTAYYRAADGVHHVPKRPLSAVLLSGARTAALAALLAGTLLSGGCRTVDDRFYWPWEEPPQVDSARQEQALLRAQHDSSLNRNQIEGLVQTQQALDTRLGRLEAASAENARLRADIAALRRDVEQVRAERDSLRKEIVDDLTDRIAKYMATVGAGSRPPTGATLKQSGYSHKVETGQTLIDIAKAYKTTVTAIRKANNLKDDRLRPGMTLFIPDPSAP